MRPGSQLEPQRCVYLAATPVRTNDMTPGSRVTAAIAHALANLRPPPGIAPRVEFRWIHQEGIGGDRENVSRLQDPAPARIATSFSSRSRTTRIAKRIASFCDPGTQGSRRRTVTFCTQTSPSGVRLPLERSRCVESGKSGLERCKSHRKWVFDGIHIKSKLMRPNDKFLTIEVLAQREDEPKGAPYPLPFRFTRDTTRGNPNRQHQRQHKDHQ